MPHKVNIVRSGYCPTCRKSHAGDCSDRDRRTKDWKRWIPDSLAQLKDMLLLVCYDVPLVVIRNWSLTQQADALKWAVKTHQRAGDHNVRIPPFPEFLKGHEEKGSDIETCPV